jgi:hypothetical protein
MKHYKQHRLLALSLIFTSAGLSAGLVQAQNITTPTQKATAQRVAQAGVALDEIAPNAPDNYTVKRGDTLWAISGLYLKQPWRWPELWGMNMSEIRNPHLIYPGQQLFLDKSSGRAMLRARGNTGGLQTIKVSPSTRYSLLDDAAIPTLNANLLEPFLAEPLLVDEAAHLKAPRFVGSDNERVLFAKGDRVYARAVQPQDLATEKDSPSQFRVYRDAVPLKDPNTGLVLAYEARYLGTAELIRGQSVRNVDGKDGKSMQEIVPATFDILSTKEEIRAGDRLIPESKRDFATYMPRAPEKAIEGVRVMSIYGTVAIRAGQNAVISLNKGAADGLEVGHVLAVVKDGNTITDKTVSPREQIKLPDERNGLAMVFRTFDKVSYALILEIKDGVKIGDKLISPR